MWTVNIDYILLVLVIVSIITRAIIHTKNYMSDYKVWKRVNRFILFLTLLDIILNFLNP
jgi:hypothetical protein